MNLENRLKRLKKIEDGNTIADWEKYKIDWINSINELESTIMHKWFVSFEEKKLMQFSINPVKRIEPLLGEYLTMSLEISLAIGKTLLFEPIAGITTDYDGKIEFSMLGNANKNVSILRKLQKNNKHEWIIATSYELKDHRKLTKAELEKFINLWLT